jgi:hypothetical protein
MKSAYNVLLNFVPDQMAMYLYMLCRFVVYKILSNVNSSFAIPERQVVD